MDEEFQAIQELCTQFDVSMEQVILLKDHMKTIVENYYKSDDATNADPKYLWPTFVQDFPNGCEHGTFLVVVLEESSFRISLYSFAGENGHSMETEAHELTEDLQERTDMELLEHIALCLQKFLKKHQRQRDPLTLAFNFCFPLKHESLVEATITKKTGPYNFKGLEEVNLGKVINEVIRSRNPRVELVALLNNATGVLLSCRRNNPRCQMGLVVGVGTSIAYVEETQKLAHINNGRNFKPFMIVHYDCGAFGTVGVLSPILTDLDRHLDESTKNPGERLFEKLVTVVYAAEMARLIFMICVEKGILFGGDIGHILKTPYSFTSRHLIEVLCEEPEGTFDNTRLMFDRLGVKKPSVDECLKVHYILESVAKRSAALMAAGIACFVDILDKESLEVGIDSSIYRQSKVYSDCVQQTLTQLVGGKCSCTLVDSEDGCGKGSAILAALSVRHKFIYQGGKDII